MKLRITAGVVALLALTGCGVRAFGQTQSQGSAGQSTNTATSNTPSLTSFCGPTADLIASIPGDVTYVLRLTNNSSQAVQVTEVAVIFYGADGTEIGSDDPAQQDFPGDQEPINSFNTILIGAGQSISIQMETAKVSGAVGNWTCSLGSWSDQ